MIHLVSKGPRSSGSWGPAKSKRYEGVQLPLDRAKVVGQSGTSQDDTSVSAVVTDARRPVKTKLVFSAVP